MGELPPDSVQPAQQPTRGFRRFLATPVGRALLIALTILVVFATAAYLGSDGILLAIPVFLIVGLALPIWVGLKRPLYLALSALVVLLVVAPLTTIVITQGIYTPVPPISSCTYTNPAAICTNYPGAHPVLQNASVDPYSGNTSTNFTWVVNVLPGNLPPGNSTLWNVSLYVSSCPGATSAINPPSWCAAGYSFSQITDTLNLTNSSRVVPLTFHHVVGAIGIWDWQMGVYTLNSTTHQAYFQTLVGDPTYNGIEGPVVGDFSVTYYALIGGVYFSVFLFLGGPFFLVLVVYLVFKNRERRRQDAQRRAAGPVPPAAGAAAAAGTAVPAPTPSPTAPGPPGAAGAAATASVPEMACPNCNAVVYPNETKCWKCGADLRGASGSPAPLPSGKSN